MSDIGTYTPPLTVTIPTPSYIPRARGRNATTDGLGGNLRVRCSFDEKNLVDEEAEELGIPSATFCRWCITEVAKSLRKERLKTLQGESNDK